MNYRIKVFKLKDERFLSTIKESKNYHYFSVEPEILCTFNKLLSFIISNKGTYSFKFLL